MIESFYVSYLNRIENSDHKGMDEFWLTQSLMKNYIIESHKSIFESFEITPTLLNLNILHEQDEYLIFEDSTKYIGNHRDFKNNITRSVWVVAKSSESFSFISCTALSVCST